MILNVEKKQWSVSILAEEHGASFTSGHFGRLTILPTPIFSIKLEDSAHYDTIREIDSASGWKQVHGHLDDALAEFRFCDPEGCTGITVTVTGHIDESGISWFTDVINASEQWSVTEITYPIPRVNGTPLNLFIPDGCGRAILNAGKQGFRGNWNYPGSDMSMQYFALWGEKNGVYLGIHDPAASMKHFSVDAGTDCGRIQITYHAPGAGESGNSFSAGGYLRWEVFDGDWYDATMLYANFVYHHANWLPVKGRPDTAKPFKEIPYWICDYIPNSEKQLDARPMTLATVSERYGSDYWLEAAIALKNRLGTPVAYHVYNWHEIPFNINYPHFLPAREVAMQGFEKLKEAGLYVFPYINAVSWEMDDADEGYHENYANTGIHGAAICPDGTPLCVPYPQKKATGQDTRLGVICPTFSRWHQIIETLTREMEQTLAIDGIYYDQIAAVPAYPCRSRNHTHRPGGGSWWSDSFGQMMENIQKKKPANRFYFSECNAEAYMKYFDGFLTWIWTMGDAVPAFPAIYAGYIQMIGRYTDGAHRDDDDYFRYHLAESLLFGQQLGWLNAHVVYHEERMRFLESIVHARIRYTQLFNEGRLMRPPTVEADLPPVTSSGITMRQVLSGVWQTADGEKTVLFVINVSPKPAHVVLHLHPEEYSAPCTDKLSLAMDGLSVKIIEYVKPNPAK